MTNKRMLFLSLVMTTLLIILTSVTLAFLLDYHFSSHNATVGMVQVEIEAFYQRGEEVLPIDISQTGAGVVELNISDPTQLEHFNNFRVNIKIKSDVDTYFRVAIYEQFTLTYSRGDTTMVVAVTKDNYSIFAYNNDDFYDNRRFDQYFYYIKKVKRVNDTTPFVIEFIGELPEIDYHPIYESKYTLLIGFIVDAVQYIDGPLMNWGLENPPWPDSTGW